MDIETQTIVATTIEPFSSVGLVLQDVPAFPDGAGNVFEAICFGDAGNGHVRVQKKERDTGRVLAELVVTPNNGMKGDSVYIFQSGADVHGRIGTHQPGPQNPENGEYQAFVWAGIATPYPNGMQPVGMAGAYLPTVVTPTPSVDEIAQAVRAILQQDFDRTVNNMKPKALAAIQEAGVLTDYNFHASGGVYARFSDSLYEYGLNKRSQEPAP